jgi:hypothetical protein
MFKRFAALAFFLPTIAGAVTDQAATLVTGGVNANASGFTWQQQVKTGLTGKLTSVDLFFQADPNAVLQSFSFFINKGAGWQADANDFSAIATPTLGWFSIDVSSANINLTAGELFSIGVRGLGPSTGCCTLREGTYADGALYFAGGPGFSGSVFQPGSGVSLAFATHVDAVPEPSTYISMTLGVFLLWGFMRLRKTN